VNTRIPAGALGRIVVLADRADAGWQATLDGRRLDPITTAGWAQSFVLPTEGGALRITYAGGLPAAVGALQSAVLALAVLGLLPLPRLRRRVAAPAPPQPSRPVPRVTGSILAAEDLPPLPQVFDQDHPEEGDVAPLFTDVPDERPDDASDDPVDVAPDDASDEGGADDGASEDGASVTPPSWVLQPTAPEAGTPDEAADATAEVPIEEES
jgi:hypothetical protein